MIKIDVWPSFLNRSCFELKQAEGAWELFVAKDAVEGLDDPGMIWHQAGVESSLAEKLVALTEDLVTTPPNQRHLGLDGVSIYIHLLRNGKEESVRVWSPEPESRPGKLMQHLFGLVEKSISKPACHNYMELLGTYFSNATPVKVVKENPYVLRVYGHLTTRDLDHLSGHLAKLKRAPQGILDMTNFMGCGYGLNSCFQTMMDAPHISIETNPRAWSYFRELGFSKEVLGTPKTIKSSHGKRSL